LFIKLELPSSTWPSVSSSGNMVDCETDNYGEMVDSETDNYGKMANCETDNYGKMVDDETNNWWDCRLWDRYHFYHHLTNICFMISSLLYLIKVIGVQPSTTYPDLLMWDGRWDGRLWDG